MVLALIPFPLAAMSAFGLDIALVMLATATMILGTMAAFELALLLLVARPMLAFITVLATLGREDAAS